MTGETQASSEQAPDTEKRPRVLIVDDVEDNREILIRRLRRQDFETEAAADGESALALLRTGRFDVVVLDWMMPGMSGLEVLDRIRERFGKTELPVLMATAKTESDAVVEALRRGANDYVSKPIDFPVLLARINAQLSMRTEAAAKRTLIDARDDIPSGTVIDGRYEILEKVGEGGFASVYRARQLSTDQTVAFKLLLPSRARRKTGETELARFLREMRVIAELDHPHVVRLVDSGKLEVVHDDYGAPPKSSSDAVATVAERPRGISGTQRSEGNDTSTVTGAVPFLVMEFLHGEPLARLFERERKLTIEAICDLAVPILCALGAAHLRGVIHRDVKPHNILLVTDHQGHRLPKVLDFGIAKVIEPGVEELTQTDSFIGTPEYMSPEQGRGKRNIDGRADQFSVGAIIYQALTGRKLYDEESFLAMIHAVASARYPQPRDVGCHLPADFEAVLLRALAPDREHRFDSAEAFARALLPYASARIQRRYGDDLCAAPSRAKAKPAPAVSGATSSAESPTVDMAEPDAPASTPNPLASTQLMTDEQEPESATMPDSDTLPAASGSALAVGSALTALDATVMMTDPDEAPEAPKEELAAPTHHDKPRRGTDTLRAGAVARRTRDEAPSAVSDEHASAPTHRGVWLLLLVLAAVAVAVAASLQ